MIRNTVMDVMSKSVWVLKPKADVGYKFSTPIKYCKKYLYNTGNKHQENQEKI